MDTTKQPVPREAIDAYNLFIHGHIDRRSFLDRVKKVAVSSAAAAAIVDQLMPNYAAAQQVAPNDPRIRTSRETVPSPQGNGKISGLLVRPASAGTQRLPAILVVHENRGLNPHIEDVARRIALEGFMAFAPDTLTTLGGYPGDEEKAGAMFGKLDRDKMAEDLHAAAVWLKNRPDSTGRLGATGFCFGGGVANSLAVRMGADLQAAVACRPAAGTFRDSFRRGRRYPTSSVESQGPPRRREGWHPNAISSTVYGLRNHCGSRSEPQRAGFFSRSPTTSSCNSTRSCRSASRIFLPCGVIR